MSYARSQLAFCCSNVRFGQESGQTLQWRTVMAIPAIAKSVHEPANAQNIAGAASRLVFKLL